MSSGKISDFRLPNVSKEEYRDQKRNRVSCLKHKRNRVVSIRQNEMLKQAQSMATEIEGLINKFQKSLENGPARSFKGNHHSITGWLPVDGCSNSFESTLERDFAYLALFDHRVESLHTQPVTIAFTNTEGKRRHYTPDFLVTFKDQSTARPCSLIEVKYEAELKEGDSAREERFEAGKNWAAKRGMKFYVVTDDHIRLPHLHQIKALFPFRTGVPGEDESISWAVLDFVETNPDATIEDILSANSKDEEGRNLVQRSIWILLARHYLYADLGTKMSGSSRLSSEPMWSDPTLSLVRPQNEKEIEVE